jgi:hypothetical protein
MGVSALTVYNWEAGKSKPRRSQLPRIVAVRGIGKREAMQRLGMTDKKAEEPSKSEATKQTTKESPKASKRGTFKLTAQEFVSSLLQGRKVLTSAEINVAWKKAGRAGNADNTLSLMVKAKSLKRRKIEGQRGSEYRRG